MGSVESLPTCYPSLAFHAHLLSIPGADPGGGGVQPILEENLLQLKNLESVAKTLRHAHDPIKSLQANVA